MKNLCFLILFLCGALSVNTLNAQAYNQTDEPWVINYYGATTLVPANSTVLVINIGTDCSAGISVQSAVTAVCSNVFTAPGTWIATCSMFTNMVGFGADVQANYVCSPIGYANPKFGFN